MTNETYDYDSSLSRPSGTEEWLDRLASSEGMTRDEVVELLVSGYVSLHDIFSMMKLPSAMVPQGDGGQRSSGATQNVSQAPPGLSDEILAELTTIVADLKRIDVDRIRQFEQRSLPPEDVDDHVVSRADVEGLHREIMSRYTATTVAMEQEFGHIQTILTYLVNSVDSLEASLTRLERNQEDEIATLREEQRSVGRLKREARRLGIETAACAGCGESIAPATLSVPTCHSCHNRFTSISPKTRWLWFGTPTLEIAPNQRLRVSRSGVLPELVPDEHSNGS